MLTTNVLIAAASLIPRLLNWLSSASANVNLPSRLSGSAMTSSATIQPARKPME